MKFDGYDLNMVGGVLATGSALLLAKAYLLPSFPHESATTFLGTNPFQIRNAIVQRVEATAGAIWLVASLVVFLMGYAWTAYGGEIGFLFGPFGDACLILAGGVVAWYATIAVTGRLSRRVYLPRMIDSQRELFELASFAIAHAGLYRHDLERQPSAEVRQERLRDASRRLDQIGKLTDVARRVGEADREYLERLRPFFDRMRPITKGAEDHWER